MSARPRFRVIQTVDDGDRFRDAYSRAELQPQPLIVQFTARELEVIHLIAASFDTPSIAEQLGIDEREVELHMRQVVGKLEARSKAQPNPALNSAVEL
jgi:DNA-binding NarL/FixJ family response regulator